MNAGLSNLATLKAWLLPAAMVDGTDYDAQILAIGRGAAAAIESYCGRKFARAVDDTFECPADVWHVVLPRFPLEAAPAIKLRTDINVGFEDQTYGDLVVDHNLNAGLIKFGARAGTYNTRLQFTSTGGYWWEQLEPTDDGYPTSQPSGSFSLPDDLQLAWRLQCEWIWQRRDKLGLSIGDKPGNIYSGSLSKIQLIDGVKEMLGDFIRHSITA